MSEPQTCDWCAERATHITHHERKNTGTLTAYWCDRHYEENRAESERKP